MKKRSVIKLQKNRKQTLPSFLYNTCTNYTLKSIHSSPFCQCFSYCFMTYGFFSSNPRRHRGVLSDPIQSHKCINLFLLCPSKQAVRSVLTCHISGIKHWRTCLILHEGEQISPFTCGSRFFSVHFIVFAQSLFV